MEKNKYNSKQLEKILDEDCPSVDDYLTWINQYLKYCIPKMAECWKENVRKIIYSPLVPKPDHQDNPNKRFVLALSKRQLKAIVSPSLGLHLEICSNFYSLGLIIKKLILF